MAGEKRAGAAVRALLVAAADRLTRAGKAEFTEWELTVAAWQADPARFGLPGFEAAHPDHKRVSCELVAGRRRSLLGDGWLERVRPSVYRVTAIGRDVARRLAAGEAVAADGRGRPDPVTAYAAAAAFARWRDDPEYPQAWADAAAFFAADRRCPADPVAAADFVDRAVARMIDRVRDENLTTVRGPGRAEYPVSVLYELADFMTALRHRFKRLGSAQGNRNDT
jgi:hypothetical protein